MNTATATRNGEHRYYNEIGTAPTGCDFSVEISPFGGKHYYLRPLRDGLPRLRGRGITWDEQYSTYKVTANAYSKLKQQYRISREIFFD